MDFLNFSAKFRIGCCRMKNAKKKKKENEDFKKVKLKVGKKLKKTNTTDTTVKGNVENRTNEM